MGEKKERKDEAVVTLLSDKLCHQNKHPDAEENQDLLVQKLIVQRHFALQTYRGSYFLIVFVHNLFHGRKSQGNLLGENERDVQQLNFP